MEKVKRFSLKTEYLDEYKLTKTLGKGKLNSVYKISHLLK
jgi:hypothetical protein